MSDDITADVNAAANEIIVDDDLHQAETVLPQPEHAASSAAEEHAAAEAGEDQDTSALIAEAVAAATAAAINGEGKFYD